MLLTNLDLYFNVFRNSFNSFKITKLFLLNGIVLVIGNRKDNVCLAMVLSAKL
ncbi:MAG: hypothetical protein ACLRQF_00490 [Thomasclavelia ramosa]